MNAIEEIEKLAKLRDRGVLTDEEFKELKAYTLSLDNSHPPAKEESSKHAIKPKPEPIIETSSEELEPKEIQHPIEESKPPEITKTDAKNVNPYANTVATEQQPQNNSRKPQHQPLTNGC